MPPVDLSTLPVKRVPFQYTHRDVILYAVAEGAGFEDHKFVWERHPSFDVLPTYITVLAQKADTFDLRPFEVIAAQNAVDVPGIKIDPKLVLDGGRTIEWLAPIPLSAKGETISKTTGVYDVGSAAVIETTSTVVANGVEVARIVGQRFCRGAGGFGGPRPPKEAGAAVPEGKAPDAVMEIKIPLNQTLIYRLSGDTMPQHVDLELAKANNWQMPIVMGLGTYGMTGRAILKHFAGDEPSRMKSMKGRFSAVVYPGETLRVEMWKVRETADEVEVAFVSRVDQRKGTDGKGLVVMNMGSAVCRKAAPGAKI
ncbi:HotDog domain-containing protein [Hyaloraphidium curvatum]|nr:HotDog domain-containing protein [Hyaloraphidium curvatum]